MTYTIYDNGGETADCYTAFKEGNTQNGTPQEIALSFCDNPESLTGVSCIGYAVRGNHLGDIVNINKFPPKLMDHVISRLS